MKKGLNNVNYYIGTIVATARDGHELLKNKPEFQEAIIDIPGIIQGILAFPINGMNDEPRKGDTVLVMAMDPKFGSYYLYQTLKEDDFIGFRASGKMIDVTPDHINIGVYDENDPYTGDTRPDTSALANVEITKDGAITIHAAKDITINTDANCNITVTGNANIKAKNATVEASGTLTTNGGTWKTTNGVAKPTGIGPFCGIAFCPFSGAPQCSQQC